jgi:hypothetical protein
MEIEAEDIRRLALEVGIRTGRVVLQAVRLEPRPLPHPVHRGRADPQPLRQAADRPVEAGGLLS